MAQEKQFENKVKRYLESIGCYNFGTEKQKITNPVVGYWEKRWGGGQFTKSGLPDMHIVLHSHSIEAEIKAGNYHPTLLQLKNLDLVTKSSDGFILVEHESKVISEKEWIKKNFPDYSHIPIINFEQFKNLCKSFY